MQLGSIFIGLALALVVAIAVLDPLVRARRARAGLAPASGPAPEERYRQVLLALRDLDFDFQTGKVEPADYEVMRPSLMAEAAELLEALGGHHPDLEAAIEQQVAERRRTSGGDAPHCGACGAPCQREDRFCTHCGAKLAALCRECGRPALEEDAFCAFCGSALASQEGANS